MPRRSDWYDPCREKVVSKKPCFEKRGAACKSGGECPDCRYWPKEKENKKCPKSS